MRVHLVEDNPDLAMLVEHVLDFLPEQIDLQVTASNFPSLLHHEAWENVDVALVDVLLGDNKIDGRDVLRWLRTERPDIRRVVFSAVGNVYPELEELADVVLTKNAVGSGTLLSALGLDPDAG